MNQKINNNSSFLDSFGIDDNAIFNLNSNNLTISLIHFAQSIQYSNIKCKKSLDVRLECTMIRYVLRSNW